MSNGNRRPYRHDAGKREAFRRELFERQGGLCHLCGKPMTLQRRTGKRAGAGGSTFASFDHLIPKANGGRNYRTNFRLAHRKCNSARNHRPIERPVSENDE